MMMMMIYSGRRFLIWKKENIKKLDVEEMEKGMKQTNVTEFFLSFFSGITEQNEGIQFQKYITTLITFSPCFLSPSDINTVFIKLHLVSDV
jgi:hypothetical protein